MMKTWLACFCALGLSTAPHAAIAQAWRLETLPDDLLGGGCFSAYRISDVGRDWIFVEYLDQEPAMAKIKLHGKIFDLISTESRVSGDNGGWDPTGMTFDDTFTDAKGKIVVKRHATVTQFSEAYDGNLQEGTLKVTYKGLSRSFKIKGGVAC